ncbi:unnamed protein product, partial [Arabidopsis halleri]
SLLILPSFFSKLHKTGCIISINKQAPFDFFLQIASWKALRYYWSSLHHILMDSSFSFRFCATAITFFTFSGTIYFMFYRKFRFHHENKAEASTTATSSSSLSIPSSLSRNWKHHVFPNFHGPDVRKTFLAHMLKEFKGKGIDSFIDNDIERTKSIGPELIEAIRGSKIAIVLLSKNYASSSWCLNELVEIMNCREDLGQIVMTIFYEVDPTDVKKQTGDFGKAFKKTCKGKTKEEIKGWKKALDGVATIAGDHSRNWYMPTYFMYLPYLYFTDSSNCVYL